MTDTMTDTRDEVEIDVDLDAALRCENWMGWDGPVCDETAEWIMRGLCPRCGLRPPRLLCDLHMKKRAGGIVVCCMSCGECHPSKIVSMVRL